MYYITHFVVPIVESIVPNAGLKRVFFYVQQDNPDEFFFPGDSEPIPKEQMDRFVASKHVVPFSEKILLKQDQVLYANPKGIFYLANYSNSELDREEIGSYNPASRKFTQTLTKQ